jgi:hypothetical protein
VDVRSVRHDRIDDQGQSLTVDEKRVFGAEFRAIDGAGADFFTPADSADMGCVHDDPFVAELPVAELRGRVGVSGTASEASSTDARKTWRIARVSMLDRDLFTKEHAREYE